MSDEMDDQVLRQFLELGGKALEKLEEASGKFEADDHDLDHLASYFGGRTFTRQLDPNGVWDIRTGMYVESDETYRRRIMRTLNNRRGTETDIQASFNFWCHTNMPAGVPAALVVGAPRSWFRGQLARIGFWLMGKSGMKLLR